MVSISDLKKRNLHYIEEIQISDRFTITKSSNRLYLAWDDYDGEVIASSLELDEVKQAIKDYVQNSFHLDE